jgi:hypothetical protein
MSFAPAILNSPIKTRSDLKLFSSSRPKMDFIFNRRLIRIAQLRKDVNQEMSRSTLTRSGKEGYLARQSLITEREYHVVGRKLMKILKENRRSASQDRSRPLKSIREISLKQEDLLLRAIVIGQLYGEQAN